MIRPFQYHLLLLLLSTLFTWPGVEGNIEVRLKEILNLEQYDGALRPQLRQGPTRVNVSLVLHSLQVDETRQVVEVSGQLMQEWDDTSLNFLATNEGLLPSVALSGTAGAGILQQVWRPDLTADQQIRARGHDADFLRIERNGHISWTQRVHYDFPCNLDLTYYPLRSHECVLTLTSLGYEAKELDPAWQGEPVGSLDHSNVVVSHGYSLAKVSTTAKTVYIVHRAKRQLRVVMTVAPKSGWAIKHTVIPMIATVTTAYLAFFISIRGATARMLTCMLSLVTAAIFHESTYRKVPQAHETMAIEVFTGTCLSFIFIAALETVVVEVLSHTPCKGRRSPSSPRNSFALEPDLMESQSGSRGYVAALWLDRCFRILYPVGFLAFNAVYWVIYG